MFNKILSNITIVNSNEKGKKVKIKVVSGIESFIGKEFSAKKILKDNIVSYHVKSGDIETYFLEKDIIEI